MTGYDVIVIGGGPGGYVCAICCAQIGMRVACVEGRDTLGGTCLNIGCIPSKALLHASHQLHEAQHNFGKMGLDGAVPVVNWPQMLAYKDDTIAQNTKGIEFLFKKNKIDWIKGWATIPAPGKVKVGDTVYETGNIVIATGSEPASLPGVDIDESTVVTSTGALSLASPPRRLVVIGAGVIGLELGSVYARLGSKVTVIEYLETITPGMDAEVAANLQRLLKRQGLAFVLGAKVSAVERVQGGVEVKYMLRKDGSTGILDADTVLVATGRRPFARGLALAELGIQTTGGGQIETDSRWMTTVPGIYAIGDVVRGPMLAHKAEDEGMAVAQIIAGKAGHVNHHLIPGVIYTWPEVASVGETEETLKNAGRAYKVGRFSFVGNGRAKAVFAGDGFVKILADTQTDRILGAHIIGPGAGDLIHEICVGMEFGAAASDIARTCHAHPTFSEAVREAALACGDGPIHA